jgi:hypothetical protein
MRIIASSHQATPRLMQVMLLWMQGSIRVGEEGGMCLHTNACMGWTHSGPPQFVCILTCAISQFTRLTFADHEPTITGLNTHTRIIPSKYKQGTPLFYAAFDKFIRPLKESEYDDVSYLSNHTSDLARAYFQFRCVVGEIHDVQPVFLSGPARLACMKPGLQIEAEPLGSSVQPAE